MPAFAPEGAQVRLKLNVIPAAGGPPVHTLDMPNPYAPDSLRWDPAGDAVTFIREVDDVSNVWRRPLAGGAPRQVTNFKAGKMFDFGWSADGKRIIFTRGERRTDIVLITDFR